MFVYCLHILPNHSTSQGCDSRSSSFDMSNNSVLLWVYDFFSKKKPYLMFSWICLMNGFSLSQIMSYRAQICFQSLQGTKMARENNAPELKLCCLISEPVLTWRDLCLLSHFMLWKYRLKDSQKSQNSNFLSHIVGSLGIQVFSTLQSLAFRCLFLTFVQCPSSSLTSDNNSALESLFKCLCCWPCLCADFCFI